MDGRTVERTDGQTDRYIAHCSVHAPIGNYEFIMIQCDSILVLVCTVLSLSLLLHFLLLLFFLLLLLQAFRYVPEIGRDLVQRRQTALNLVSEHTRVHITMHLTIQVKAQTLFL